MRWCWPRFFLRRWLRRRSGRSASIATRTRSRESSSHQEAVTDRADPRARPVTWRAAPRSSCSPSRRVRTGPCFGPKSSRARTSRSFRGSSFPGSRSGVVCCSRRSRCRRAGRPSTWGASSSRARMTPSGNAWLHGCATPPQTPPPRPGLSPPSTSSSFSRAFSRYSRANARDVWSAFTAMAAAGTISPARSRTDARTGASRSHARISRCSGATSSPGTRS